MRPRKLSPQEIKVGLAVCAGKLSTQIGNELGITRETVRSYRKSLYTKLGIQDVYGLYTELSKIHSNVPQGKLSGKGRYRYIIDALESDRDRKPCWLWPFLRTDIGGYGYLTVNGVKHKAHRLSYELHTGKPIPNGFYACHTCDNRRCFNPTHLYAGTPKDNMADVVNRHRLGWRRSRAFYKEVLNTLLDEC